MNRENILITILLVLTMITFFVQLFLSINNEDIILFSERVGREIDDLREKNIELDMDILYYESLNRVAKRAGELGLEESGVIILK